MATTTFPALDVRPIQQPDVLGQMAKIAQLRATLQQQQFAQQQQPLQLQQEQQAVALQAQQLKDVQAGQNAFGEWDGKSYTDLAGLIIKHGGSLNAAQQVAAYGLSQQQKLADILKTQADAGQAQITTLQKQHDTAAGAVNALLSLPDDQLQQGVLNTAQRGMKEGWFDQQHFAMAQQLAQQSPQQIRAALPNIAKGYQAESQIAEDALKQAQAFEATQRGQELQAQMAAGGTPQMQDVQYTALQQKRALGQPTTPQEDAFIQAYEKRKLLVPQFRVENQQGPQGTWQLVEDTQGNPMVFNSVTGATQPAPGIQKTGTYQKTVGGPQAAVNYATTYLNNKQFTGPGDEALMEQFFEMAKPSSGFRMSQPQIDMLKNAQSWMNSADALKRHATTGTWFSDDQRQQIVGTMNVLGSAKGIKPGGINAAQTGGGGAPQVGQKMTLKNGKTVTVTAVHPDGSWDAQ